MAKANIEKASDAWVNPPTPEDPTSDVTRNDGGSSGEPLHKPPMDASDEDRERYESRGAGKPVAVPSPSGRDANRDGVGGPAEQGADRWKDDPMPEGAQERLEWVQRGTDTADRIDAALRAEEARGTRKRGTLLSGLRALQAEEKSNRREESRTAGS
jgi:hypothetical protein